MIETSADGSLWEAKFECETEHDDDPWDLIQDYPHLDRIKATNEINSKLVTPFDHIHYVQSLFNPLGGVVNPQSGKPNFEADEIITVQLCIPRLRPVPEDFKIANAPSPTVVRIKHDEPGCDFEFR